MADVNSRVLPAASWVPAKEWAEAPPAAREKYIRRVCELARAAKLRQVIAGKGADGKPLAPVKPSSRPDGARGRPLDPHYGESRAVKWCRAVPGFKGGTVTIHWSHGWGRILGYHARGEVIGAYIRNIIDFPPGIERRLIADARHYWRGLIGWGWTGPATTQPHPSVPKPKPRPTPRPGIAARPRPNIPPRPRP